MISPMRCVSYCEVGDRLIFLDIAQDRYFCLNSRAESDFRKLARGVPDWEAPGERGEDALPLIASGTGAPRPCVGPAAARQSLLDEPQAPAGPARTWSAMARLHAARLRFRLQSLPGALASFDKATRRSAPRPASAGELAAQVAGFRAAEQLLTTRDFCLSHSYAIARYMLARGLAADLVFGVRLGPFAAHCWAQHGDWLLNDRLDTIRTFTPILGV
jgi:hypothetical protein